VCEIIGLGVSSRLPDAGSLSSGENEMPKQLHLSCMTAVALVLTACAGESRTYDVGNRQVTMPEGTMTGAASHGNANALAEMIVASNTSAMERFDTVQAAQQEQLKTSQQALAKLEELSNQQGSGQLTLFFKIGSAQLAKEQQERLVRFLDYISVKANGRAVILVSIGGASSEGAAATNRKLSEARSQAPVDTIEQYLVHTSHRFYKVSGVGDMYAPKNAPADVDQRYQNVRIIAAYNEKGLAGAPVG
jgi:outer membrane protein OmpA-like peptidoglycan-associated protein